MNTLSKIAGLAAESVGRTATLVRHAYGSATTILIGLFVALIARDLIVYESATGLSAAEGIGAAFGTIGVMQIVSTVSCLVVAAVVLLAIVGGLECFQVTGGHFGIRRPVTKARSAVHGAIYWLGITVATVHALVWPWLECNAGGAFRQTENGFSARPLVESWAFPLLAWVRVKVNWMVGLGVSVVVTTFFAKLWTFIHTKGPSSKEPAPEVKPGEEPTPAGSTPEPLPGITPGTADGRGPRRKRDAL